MKISPTDRVIYRNNPLAEVVCQIRFDRIEQLERDGLDPAFKAFVEAEYPVAQQEQAFGFSLQLGGSPTASPQPKTIPSTRIFHQSNSDKTWRVSLCADFLALNCKQYTSWDAFLPRMLDCAAAISKSYKNISPTRIGLRYKDLIERDKLGLDGTPWHQLIRPFLLGPLAENALSTTDVPD
ncbi:MAG: TIGR04255 family protein, partial [Variovorax sp.]|nr:TIGR04255 family protein [Variovorax sp.]